VNTEQISRIRAIRLGVALLALGAGISLNRSARAANDKGWYTQAQAASGHQFFNNYCAECHRPDLTGAQGPALVGDAFVKQWSSKPLSALFGFEHSNMPANNPGSLPDDTMWAITAYILQKNGFPAGSTALSQPTAANRALTSK
jgi:S-disulfanyl-L-cysteine oxidoreductase SoxD